MQDDVCVISMVRDDEVMLKKFVDYYGGFFGKEALYIINHGDQAAVRKIAKGCNLVPIPDSRTAGFTARAWRTYNHLMNAMRQWYKKIIVVDIDEFVVVDPASGEDLGSFMAKARGKTVRTPLGLEIVHLLEKEKKGIEKSIIGPRQHVQLNSWYSKPCLISTPTRLSRGGHFATHPNLDAPDMLYLFHMKYCDFDLYADTLDRRSATVQAQGVESTKETTTSKQWFGLDRDDQATFDKFAKRQIETKWDFSEHRQKMQDTFGVRVSDMHHFEHPKSKKLFKVPERFFGIV